jgi:PPM family protein phosphatase
VTALRWGAATDVGRRRTTQQDMILAAEPLFAVADGMGGHAGGEIASLTAVEALKAAFSASRDAAALEDAVQAANRAVQDRAAGDPNLRSMGTTLAVAALVPDTSEGDVFLVANIGDSRIYLLRDNELSQLTDDHSVPQELYRAGQLTEAEAAIDPRKNMITRALGMPDVEPDLQTLVPFVGDRLLLCSDGLTNEVGFDEIRGVLLRIDDPDEAARTLVDMANAHGGNDNISVLIVDVVDDEDRAGAASTALRSEPSRLMTSDQRNAELRSLARDQPPSEAGSGGGETQAIATPTAAPVHHEAPPRRVTARVVLFVLVVLLLLGGAGAAVGWYARGSYYVGLEDTRVVIFKGRPGGLLWFKPTAEVRTALTETDVLPARLDDLRAGKEEPSLEEAQRYVRNLEDEAAQRRAASGQAGAEDPTATTTTAPPAQPAPTAPPP